MNVVRASTQRYKEVPNRSHRGLKKKKATRGFQKQTE